MNTMRHVLRTPGVFLDREDDALTPGGNAAVATPPREPSDALRAANEAVMPTQDERNEMRQLIEASRALLGAFQAERARSQTGDADTQREATTEMQRLANENAQIRRELEDLASRLRTRAAAPETDDLFNGERHERFRIGRAVQAAYVGWDSPALRDTPERRAIQRWAEEKALPHDTIGNMGVIVPQQYMTDYIERLSARTVAFALGARFMGDLTGAPVEWPKVEGGASAEWIGENAEPTDSEITVGSLRLAPKELACSAPITKRLLRLAGPVAQDLIEEDLMRAHSETFDLGIINGGGGEAVPLGIVNVPGVGQTDWNGGGTATEDIATAATADGAGQNITEYLDLMIAKVDARNAYDNGGGMGWACHPLLLNQLRRAKDADGRPIMIPAMDGNNPNPSGGQQGAQAGVGRGLLWGHPVATTTNLAFADAAGGYSDLIFGNWREIIVGGWGPMEIEVSDNYQNYFKLRRLLILVTQLVDAGLRHPEAFEIATNLDPTAMVAA